MQTITKDNLSLYIYADDVVITSTEAHIQIGADDAEPQDKMIIADLNSSNADVHTGVTSPEDWSGAKYNFDGTNWTRNADWTDPLVFQLRADKEMYTKRGASETFTTAIQTEIDRIEAL